MTDTNLPVADADQNKEEITAPSTEKAPVAPAAADMPENKTVVPKVQAQAKPKLSVWTEVTDQTLEQLKEKAKVTYDQLSSGSSKEKTPAKK